MRAGILSPVALTEAVLQQIERLNPDLNAYVTVTAEAARDAASEAERAVERGADRLGPLHGIPVSIKDMIRTAGVRTTSGSRLKADFVPEDDAPSVERLKAAGAIVIGKTNTPDHGWLGVTDNPLFGVTRNPWDLERTPGGSSGGASAALAAGMAPLALGSDAGGSIRGPAALTGVVGFKPTFGRVPVYPLSSAWSFAHVGPMSRTVADAALMLNVISGPDSRDPHSLPADDVDYLAALEGDLGGLRVAWSGTFGYATVDSEVLTACERAAGRFESFGCTVEPRDPNWIDARPTWHDTWLGGAAAKLGPLDRERPGELDPGLSAKIESAQTWSATDYADAWFDRLAFVDEARKFFSEFDLLISPTVGAPAFEIGLEGPETINGAPVSKFAWKPFGFPFNMTGQPAISVPCGFTAAGLPIGLQIVGHRFEDATVLRAAARFEEAQPWADHRPPLG